MVRVGVDLGGTNTVAGIVDDGYKIIQKVSLKTELPKTEDEIAELISKAVNDAVCKAGISLENVKSVGIGSPGSVSFKDGIVYYSNNLNLYNSPLKKLVEERLNKKCFIENDANAAAFGEYLCGAGKGSRSFVLLTLGTGIGGGVIIDGKILSGVNCAAGELGHTVIKADGVKCNCGRRGCFERYASATALIRQTKSAMRKNKNSALWKLTDGNINNVNGKSAFDGYRLGDKTATEVVNKYLYYLSVGTVNVVNIFQPEVIAIGGGISYEGDILLKYVNDVLSREDYARNIKDRVKVKTASLFNDAGIIGAAFLDTLE